MQLHEPFVQPLELQICLQGNTSQHFSRPTPDFTIQGDVRGKSFVIRRQQQMAAEVSSTAAYVVIA